MKEYICKEDLKDAFYAGIYELKESPWFTNKPPNYQAETIEVMCKVRDLCFTQEIDGLPTLTKADICREFGDWYFNRIKLPEEEREKFKNEWNDLVRDYIAEMEKE